MPKASQRELEAKLAALNQPEWDSSDEDEENVDVEMMGKTIEKKNKVNFEKKCEDRSSKESKNEGSDVIYIGHIPREFEERELKGFLGQFGRVLKLRLSRSRKTANSRCFAFAKFEDEEVASIVAGTMSGYLMGEKRLVCHVVPKDKIHSNLFKGCNSIFKKVNFRKIHRNKVNRPKSAEKMKTITKTLISREQKKREKLKELGIDYDFPGYEASNKAFSIEDKAQNDNKNKVTVSKPPKKQQTIDASDEKSPGTKRPRKESTNDNDSIAKKLRNEVHKDSTGAPKTPTNPTRANNMESSADKVKSSKKKKKKGKV
mmetsp:Transcript_1323/g.2000  ORF Transcript_1323/g.2000 Transcript_1323/m.2000 type:complete len:316 (-) Transcript_1323:121-1068(-)|eukprot:CAMPEP_0194235162 /NCGR_PEP_ID=MMETSP0158-20130606/2733_1 /TAXON_ID=33649 /ORGANISM="Thalassionema nitzschioides, Strain L26-B" /LENGTH=315 /DNA_ID=CAMNT_0038968561 /DNA_START=28 /DNA_END=975 /DNA_ORIENTATION=-